LPLDAPEELEAVGVAGEQAAFEQVEGQDLQADDALGAVGHWIAVHLLTSLRQRVR